MASSWNDLPNTERSDDEVWVVAERDERFVGYVQAKIDRPAEDACRQILRDLGEPVLKVTALLVVEDQRRMGVGTALMRAVEVWAKSRGATRAFLNTYQGSRPQSRSTRNGWATSRGVWGFGSSYNGLRPASCPSGPYGQ